MNKKLTAVIGHRGLALLAPENTLSGLRKAYESGLSWVEVDVMLSKDQVPLLLHDQNLDRTTNAKGLVGEQLWRDLKQLDAGAWFSPFYANEALPNLQQALQLCSSLNLGINLELKPNGFNNEHLLHQTLRVIKNFRGSLPSIILSSFCKTCLLLCHQIAPQIALGYLVDDKDNNNEIVSFADKIECFSVHLPSARVEKNLINQLHSNNKKVLAFTVNKPREAEQLFKLGVDAIFSDLPLAP